MEVRRTRCRGRGHPPHPPFLQAMRALGQLVDGHAGGQQALARATISVVGRPLPVVQALLRTALRAPAAAERAAGASVLRGLSFRNEGVQMELLATVTPVPSGEAGGERARGGALENDRTEPLCGALPSPPLNLAPHRVPAVHLWPGAGPRPAQRGRDARRAVGLGRGPPAARQPDRQSALAAPPRRGALGHVGAVALHSADAGGAVGRLL